MWMMLSKTKNKHDEEQYACARLAGIALRCTAAQESHLDASVKSPVSTTMVFDSCDTFTPPGTSGVTTTLSCSACRTAGGIG